MDAVLPLSLRPDSSISDCEDIRQRIRALRHQIDTLKIQAWILAFARTWEQRLAPLGVERLSLNQDNYEHTIHVWRNGVHLRYRCLNPHVPIFYLDDGSVLPQTEAGDDLIYTLKDSLDGFPVEVGDARTDVLFSPEGHDLSQWRGLVLQILSPEDRAAFEHAELARQITPARTMPRRRV